MRFALFYKGPATPPDASHEGWPEWFGKTGAALADKGSALANGISVKKDGSQAPSLLGINGYTIIEAENIKEAQKMISDHPYLAQGDEYSIEVFELPES